MATDIAGDEKFIRCTSVSVVIECGNEAEIKKYFDKFSKKCKTSYPVKKLIKAFCSVEFLINLRITDFCFRDNKLTGDGNMRKLKLQVQMTINGFVGGANGELDWMTWVWDEELKNYVEKITTSFDTILLGRKMTDGFISHWTSVLKDKNNSEYDAAKKFIDTPKVVFTKTLEKSAWINTELAKSDIVEEVNNLKDQDGKDIIVYGGASFVSSLIKNNLIDEYYLFVNPATLKEGLTIFGETDKMNLKLEESKAFQCGIVLNKYLSNNH